MGAIGQGGGQLGVKIGGVAIGHGIGRDLQSAVTSMDGRFLFIISAGFQKFESGLFVLDIATDTPLGFIPAPGGHHDIALIPRAVSDMKYTRAICM